MLKITVQPDCGNAPKKVLLKDFTIAFAKGDIQFILKNLSDNIEWEIVGDQKIHGKSDAEKVLKQMLDASTTQLNIVNIITHGDEGAVNGTMKFGEGPEFGFSDFYTFTSHGKDAKIKQLTSFVVEKK